MLIVLGLLKKAVIADWLAVSLVDKVFFDPTAYGTIDLLARTYGYAVQIYCDFSVTRDIAIGIGALLGYRFPRNFDQPYRRERSPTSGGAGTSRCPAGCATTSTSRSAAAARGSARDATAT